ncbi:MAG TPA: potassium channel protein [Methylomirabilota bacterium]|jgi:voltage-gated potassium channel|nr:potassium channel protein [Methylomirabilota bacterium]
MARRWRGRGARPRRRAAQRRSVLAELRSRFATIVLLLSAVMTLGTLGYMLIERWSAFDALYMTVITVASVGFGEVHPLSLAGRAFTMALIVVGLGTVAYGLSTITAFWVEGNLLHLWENRKMERRISELRDHIVVCGGGETGRHIAHELTRTRTPFVIIDIDARQETALQKLGRELLYIIGDATEGDVLRTARVETARGLIACMPSDKDNLFTLLTAREINPRVRLVSGVNSDDTRGKLLRAGADAVVSSRAIGALRLASEMVRPHVVSFLDSMLREPGAVRVQEIAVGPAGAGKSLGEVQLQQRVGIVVFALRSAKDRHHHYNPPLEHTLEAGDVLIACASHDQLQAARKIVDS